MMSIHELDVWRLVELVDEPLYCAASALTHPDDAICYNSDEDLDSTGRLAKRQRYEAAGQRFLRGERPRLLSARLKGPFDASSGWVNPWLPKATSTESSAAAALRPEYEARPHSAINSKLAAVIQEGQQSTSLATTVSKQSLSQVIDPSSGYSARARTVTPDAHSDVDKRIQIQVWADNVETGLPENDLDFWNPRAKERDQDQQESGVGDVAPRWLKKTPLKRKRPDALRHGSASSATEPPSIFRSASDPTALRQRTIPSSRLRRLEASSLVKSRSFELTTPSSMADPRAVDIMQEAHSEALSTSDCPSMSGAPAPSLENHGKAQDLEIEGLGGERSAGSSPQPKVPTNRITIKAELASQGALSHSKDGAEDVFESEQDNCSHYHIGPRRLPREIADDGEGLTRAQPLTQTETPDSSHHSDELAQSHDATAISEERQVVKDSRPLQGQCNMSSVVVKVEKPEHEELLGCLHADVSQKQPSDDTASPSTTKHDEHAGSTTTSRRETSADVDDDKSYQIQGMAGTSAPQMGQTVHVTPPQETHLLGLDTIEFNNASRSPERTPAMEYATLQTIAFAASQMSKSPPCSTQDLVPLHGAADLSISQFKDCHDLPTATEAMGDKEEIAIGASTQDCSVALPLAFTTMVTELPEEMQQPTPSSRTPSVEGGGTTVEDCLAEPSRQSPWTTCSQNLLAPQVSMSNASPGHLPETAQAQEMHHSQQAASPGTPPPAEDPSASFGLKSFSRFNTPSPQRRALHKSCSRRSTVQLRGILSMEKPRTSSCGVRRRVTFAPLPGDIEDEGPSMQQSLRPASPPPIIPTTIGEEDVPRHFQKHFDSMKRKNSGILSQGKTRTLPSLSDDAVSTRASISASEVAKDMVSDHIDHSSTTPERLNSVEVTETGETFSPAEPQSPWRQDTQSEMVDDVAAVMGNLDAFLDAWSVDHEMQKASQAVDQENNHSRDQNRGKTASSRFGLQELSIWN
ncbi:hypothetical protein MN608_09749 [Microdochium nivale]|nr:hypothetical protein MN608_09749 [Microdochium nivale]